MLANWLLLRPAFAPLRRLAVHMSGVDLLRHGQRVVVEGAVEVVALVRPFNDMVDRLEGERDCGRQDGNQCGALDLVLC